MMAIVARMLAGLLLRSAWLLPPDRAEWLEGLVAEATETRSGHGTVIWLLGGAGLIARELLAQSAVRVLGFLAAAGIVVWVVWPGSSSDYAVGVNRIVVPILLVVLALLPLLVRRFYGPVRSGILARAVRVGGYLVVLALIAGHAIQEREGEKLGAYFGSGAGMSMSALAVIFAVVLAGYAAAILILTSQRVRLTRSALPIAVGTGALTGLATYARFSYHLWSGPRGKLEIQHMLLGWWAFLALGLPLLTGFLVARLASRDTLASGTIPARQGALAAMCATGGGLLLLAALTAVTIAISPQSVPLHTPPPPPNGGCETCGPDYSSIPSGLRHQYWVGLSVARAGAGPDWMLAIAPIFALFAGLLGAGLGEVSLRAGNRHDSPPTAELSAPAST
jgi:hypothetical protein